MATTEIIDIAVRADIEQLKAQLKSIPGVSDAAARAMAQNISKQLNKATLATEKAAAKANKAWAGVQKSSKGATRGLASIAQQMPDVASQLSSGTNAATVFTQQGLQVLQVNMDTTIGLMTRFAGVFGPVGAALAATGVAFVAFRNELAKADEAIRVNRERLASMVEIHRAVKEAAVLAAVAQGQMTQEAADGFFLAQKASDLFGERTEEARDRVAKLRDELHEARGALDDAGTAAEQAANTLSGMGRQGSSSTDALADTVQGLEQQLAREEATLSHLNTAQKRYVENTRTATAATLAQRHAVDLEDDTLKESAAALQAAAAAQAHWDMELRRSEDPDRAKFHARIAEVQQAQAEGYLEAAAAQKLLSAAVDDYEEKVQSVADAEDEKHRRQMAAIAAEKAARVDYAVSLVSTQLGALATIAGEYDRLFALQKAAAIAQIAVDAAVAAMKAFATLGPIGGAIAAPVIAGIATVQAAQVAAQEAPAYHVGGLIGTGGAAPDEVGISARRGEGVLTRQGVEAIGGPAGLAAANRGASMPSQIVVEHVYKQRVLNAVLQDNLGMQGSPLRQAIRSAKGRRVGQRDR